VRTFVDPFGRAWEVVIGRASWGTYLALFVPVNRNEPVRQAPLNAVAYADAIAEIDAADDTRLQTLLDESQIKEE
jgi:hypothetical protein